MSLDTLFQQIILTEQQLAEQTQKIKDGKFCLFLWICFFFFFCLIITLQLANKLTAKR